MASERNAKEISNNLENLDINQTSQFGPENPSTRTDQSIGASDVKKEKDPFVEYLNRRKQKNEIDFSGKGEIWECTGCSKRFHKKELLKHIPVCQGTVCGRRAPPAPIGLLPEDKEWLIHHTEFDEPELDRLYKLFKTDYPKGGMFRSQFSAFFPPGLATVHFCDHVFRTLDTDGNGYLDFKEFIMANDLIAARSKEEKLSWAFKVYDIDNSGEIDRGEMVRVMSSIYSMVDGNVSGAMRGGTEEKASKHAEKLFKLIDIDGDGNLTENEFLRGCLQDPELLKKLDKIVQDCQPPVAYQSSYY